MTNINKYKEQIKNLEARVIAQRAEINRLNKRRDTVERDLKSKTNTLCLKLIYKLLKYVL